MIASASSFFKELYGLGARRIVVGSAPIGVSAITEKLSRRDTKRVCRGSQRRSETVQY
ncbi:hypothetical protein CK203_087844 [Vitis vinifera]|uniref:Uncharacterized protein n=1 Tax=Vitis vinifera TaxID=29760 RepID=A0A438E4D1_VITVI|nr:hypothetical protein CK203_087844 [Vitis vinifera]